MSNIIVAQSRCLRVRASRARRRTRDALPLARLGELLGDPPRREALRGPARDARRLGRRPQVELLQEASELPGEPAKFDAAEFDDEVRRAQAAMLQLRPEQRQVLELALNEGRTHHEISVAIGIPLGTVKSHARRGLIRLRNLLGVAQPDQEGDLE
jgi:RNA polymerase sigma factor (sigma-70 family)